MISLKNVSVSFGETLSERKKILTDISLEINVGEFVILVGHNGSGKSTFLKLINRELKTSAGKLSIINHFGIKTRIEYLSQNLKGILVEELTIHENLSLAKIRLHSTSLLSSQNGFKSEFLEKLKSLNLGLEKKLEHKVKTLSGGQKQALALLMIALNPPNILLLDEHTSALDPKSAELIIKLTSELIENNKITVLMVTHNLSHALELGDRLLVFSEGRIAHDLSNSKKLKLTHEALITLFHKATFKNSY